MERLDFTEAMSYNAIEAAIHLNRYFIAKPYVQGKRVLDIACGEGYGSRLLKEWGAAEVIGVDISEEAIENASHLFGCNNLQYVKHSVEKLPFENDSFDMVVSFETIEHLDHPEEMLKEISRVVRLGGCIILSCPNDHLYAQQDPDFDNPYHKRRWTYFEFKEFSETYLGNHVRWSFGFALNGFTNIPLPECTLPEADVLPKSMLSMMDYKIVPEGVYIQAERYLNYWNANYYVGLWNCGDTSNQVEQAVFFGREFFCKPEEAIGEPLKKAYQINRAVEREKAKLEEREAELLHTLHISEINNERTSNLLKIAEEEKARLWGRINKLQQDLEGMQSEYYAFQSVKNTKAYKLIQLWWRLSNRLKSVFGRK